MNYKNIFKRETKVIAYVVICLTLVVIGTSYALFLQVNNNSNNQVVTAGSLTITYSGGNTVTVDDTSDSNCLLPQSDSEGIGTSGCVFNLSVTNTGTLPMQYNLLIYNNESDAPSGATFVDHTYIRHSLKKQFTVANKSETVTSAAALGELSTYNSTNKKILETAVIEAGETITFALNIWIDDVNYSPYMDINFYNSGIDVMDELAALQYYVDFSSLLEVLANHIEYINCGVNISDFGIVLK